MTTGSREMIIPFVTPENVSVGEIRGRNWSGVDWPDLVSKPREIYIPEKTTYRWIYDRTLRKKVRVIWNQQQPRTKLVYDVPPKRTEIEWHQYGVRHYVSKSLQALRWKHDGIGQPWGYFVQFGPQRAFQIINDPWNSNDQLKLNSKIRSKISGSSFNAGVFLGEGKKSLELITGTATRLYKGYQAARRGNFSAAAEFLTQGYRRRPQKAPKVAASSWLELQYGWFPLLQDIEEGAHFLAHHFSAPLQHRTSCVYYAGGVKPDQGLKTAIINSTHSYFCARGAPVSSSRKLTAFYTEINPVELSGLGDVASIAWETLPYSFLFDWVIPVGSYLDSRGLNQQLKATYVITARIEQNVYGPILPRNGSTIDPQYDQDDGFQREVQFSRSAILADLPMPLPEVKPLNKILSWQHAANAVALLIGLRDVSEPR